jgi:formate hydrogenlyase subunit 3/multisubunit Na+/H+ antiporter MnhD subunit
LSIELIGLGALAWLLAAILAASRIGLVLARWLLAAGSLVGMIGCIVALPHGTIVVALPNELVDETVTFQLSPDALWLMGFGLATAAIACALSTPAKQGKAGWLFGVAASLLGALGVFGLQNGAAFLIAWEVMSLGGALMVLSEALSAEPGRPVLFMLGLLEAGAVALLLAILLLSGTSFGFDGFPGAASAFSGGALVGIGLLLLAGFGAKLGVLPFFEWFPNVYRAASGASGTLMSGIVLNAAFFGLSHGLLFWIPAQQTDVAFILGTIVLAMGVVSSVLTALYAFQEEDWRSLLSFSSAENASIAVSMLGASLIFRSEGLDNLAGLAWTVSLLHLAGHTLAKGSLFLASDGVYRSTGAYTIVQSGLIRNSSLIFGVGALFAAMSLAAMPPQAGFVSEWYVFQAVFQGFRLETLAGRLIMTLAGAGLALTAAVALATSVKLFGVGLLGRSSKRVRVPTANSLAVGCLGICVLMLGVGMPLWLGALEGVVGTNFGAQTVVDMRSGLLLVPLTAKFAFISPTLLALVMPLLALLPLLLFLSSRGFAVRSSPVWYGGLPQDPARASTTALSFSNALRTFYSLVYRPREETTREARGARYFIHRLVFEHDVAPFFGPYLFRPLARFVIWLSDRLRIVQSGDLNVYLSFIGALLVIVLALVLL